MANSAVDQFTDGLQTTVLQWILIGGIIGGVLGGVVKWLERKATQIGRSRRAAQRSRPRETRE